MGDPVNLARAGELWDPHKIAVMRDELEPLRGRVVLSGGWAWHFLSPPGHVEFKMTHDHKDIDIFVEPTRVGQVIAALKDRGYARSWTRFDGKTEGFSRYAKDVAGVKVLIDLFTETVPSIVANEDMLVVEPSCLLGFYGKKLSSDACHAVRAAREVVKAGGVILNHPKLAPTDDVRIR